MNAIIVWFRQDLRISNNHALSVASEQKSPIIPLYILDDTTHGKFAIGSAQRWWIHHSLHALSQSLFKKGLNLILRKGIPLNILHQLIEETDAQAIYWQRCYEPYAIKRDTEIKEFFKTKNIDVQSFNGSLLFEPWEVMNNQKEPYKVFSQYWRKCLEKGCAKKEQKLSSPLLPFSKCLQSDALVQWNLLPSKPDWSQEFLIDWEPGEDSAIKKLNCLIEEKIQNYADKRNIPHEEGTSRLSPHLHFGEISPHQVWNKIINLAPNTRGTNKFISELGWREFSYYLLFHYPDFSEQPFRSEFKYFPWQSDKTYLEAWQKGQTGFPLVDAGMRQLWKTGWMHNRIRMVVASFLCKHLLIDWRKGEKWFYETLLDADLANNAMGWQWVAGSGVDAAPYFRIFNPILQSKKFDPDGHYIKKWIPELTNLSANFIHHPWTTPNEILITANIELGKDYPLPIVDHFAARKRALDAYREIIKKSPNKGDKFLLHQQNQQTKFTSVRCRTETELAP